MSGRSSPRPSPGLVDQLGLAAIALVGFLASDPGRVAADSRQYLYLDPGEFLRRAVSLWDPSVAAGTVPHQHLGFLWPMGPWFWLADTAGLPTWVAQRLWMAGLAAAAGIGALRLCRALGSSRAACLAAALVYQLTPYQLAFTARFSVLLLPWAALPWLVHLSRRSLSEQTWRAPIWFGLVAATAGAVNASSLVLVLIAPAAVLLAGALRRSTGEALAAGGRIAAVTAGASAWWVAGLVVQGRYGLPVLQLTENVDTVSAASQADEVIRGLGNWIFLSTDGTSALEQAAAYRDSWPVRMATVALPAAAVAVITAVRFRGRGLALGLLTLATVIAVGAAPIGDPSPYGSLWRRFSETSSVGLALRNAPRIVPVVVLVTALVLAIGVDRLAGRRRLQAAAAVALVALVALAPVVRHGFLASDFDRPEEIPDHWSALAADLDAGDARSRILEIPGANFAAYDWGNTVEPILPGLVERPTIAREVLPAGGPGTVDLLAAFDRRLQRGTFDPDSLAPIARMLGAGDVVVRGDLDAERFGLPDPRALVQALLADPPDGLRVTGRYGGTPASPLLLRLSLDDPVPRLRADGARPVLLAGSGDGIVDAAGAGIIDGRRPVLPAVSLDDVAVRQAIDSGADVLVTDSARKRATTFFYTIAADTGATEPPDRREPDPLGYDVRLGPYAEAPADQQTVAVQLGATVDASVAGSPEHPEDRAAHAFDGDPATEWRPHVVAPWGQWVQARLDEPTDLDRITVLVAPGPAQVSEVAVTVDGRRQVVALDERARTAPGQPIDIGADDVREVRVEITGVTGDPGIPGFADIALGDVVVDEALRTPTDLVSRVELGPANRLTYLLTRDRGSLVDEGSAPVEPDLDRTIEVPQDATFTVRGTGSGRPTDGCDDSLLSIDGRSFPVRAEAGPDSDVVLTGCEELRLGAGAHRIVATRYADASVDQLVLETPRPADVDSPDPELSIGDDDPRSIDAEVRNEDQRPFWLVLAESRNDGWELDLEGGRVLSTALVDGYANGWLVEPDGRAVSVSLRWTPQRIIWAGMVVTALTLVAATAGAVVGRRRRGTPPVLLDRSIPDAAREDDVALRRVAVAVIAAAVVWWFVATPVVALVAAATLAARTRSTDLTGWLAAGAATAIVLAELTGTPDLVWIGLALAGAEVAGGWLRRQPVTDAVADASG